MTAWATNRVNNQAAAEEITAQQLAENEAEGIRGLTGQKPLRLHVVGDCKTDAAAKTVSSAAADYHAKHNQPVWSYTHSWRDVARESWQEVSILASCETTADAKAAMDKGYAAAIVVPHHASTKAYVEDGVKLIPCPEQTGKSENCLSCGLCFNANRLHAIKAVIAFRPDGKPNDKNVAALKAKLIQLGGVQ
jgi:hypothetical protein